MRIAASNGDVGECNIFCFFSAVLALQEACDLWVTKIKAHVPLRAQYVEIT